MRITLACGCVIGVLPYEPAVVRFYRGDDGEPVACPEHKRLIDQPADAMMTGLFPAIEHVVWM